MAGTPQGGGAGAGALADLPAVARCGRFELLGRIGVGGMAEVYLARESVEGVGARLVVVKRLLHNVAADRRLVAMFEDEVRLAMQLSHPNVCHVLDVGESDGVPFLAMEWVDGVTLDDVIDATAEGDDPMPIELAEHVAIEIAGALHYAHRLTDDQGQPLGVVHRDVTPSNIMVGFDGNVSLIDFGIARTRTQLMRTHPGAVKGKLGYLAPEQCVGREVDLRADVFALGVCLYETLTGEELYGGETLYETMSAILDRESLPSARDVRPEVPVELDRIIQRALAMDPDHRFETAGAMRDALVELQVHRRQRVLGSQLADYLRRVFAERLREGPAIDRSPPEKPLPTVGWGVGRGGQRDATAPRPDNPVHGSVRPPRPSDVSGEIRALAHGRRVRRVLLIAVLVLIVGGLLFAILRELASPSTGAS